MADAMEMWERKIPNGVILPCETTDWSAKVADECIVDTWAKANVIFSKNRVNEAKNSQVDSTIPLISRL